MARSRTRADILFDEQVYEEAAQRVNERLQNRNASCHHGQCRGVTKAARRCSRCLNAQVAQNEKLCHNHVNAPAYFRLTRRDQPVRGYDEQIRRNKTSWLADDAIETAIRILEPMARRKSLTIDMITSGRRTIVDFSPDKKKLVCVVLLNRHWFVLSRYKPARRRHDVWWLFDSMPRTALEFRAVINYLENNFIPTHYREDRANVMLVDEQLKQVNMNDCGFFVVNTLCELVLGNSLTTTPEDVRHKATLFLTSRGQQV